MAETRKNGENVSRSQPVGADPPTGATGQPTNSSAVDPYQRKWNLWGYVDARDVGQSCRLTLEADIIGVEAIIIAKSDTVMNRPSREMLAEVFSGVPLRGDAAMLVGGPGFTTQMDQSIVKNVSIIPPMTSPNGTKGTL